MPHEHDFIKFPELTNRQIEEHQFDSPHPQITEDFLAEVIKVHDGDTIRLTTNFRDFDFPLRLLDIDAPELNEGGEVAGDWLRDMILNKTVQIRINRKNRVDKWGRLLGKIFHQGFDVGDVMLRQGLVKPFKFRKEGKLLNLDKLFSLKQWF